jgi:hypothetical protein
MIHIMIDRGALTFFLDMTISIDYFILKRGWSHEDNGHK